MLVALDASINLLSISIKKSFSFMFFSLGVALILRILLYPNSSDRAPFEYSTQTEPLIPRQSEPLIPQQSEPLIPRQTEPPIPRQSEPLLEP